MADSRSGSELDNLIQNIEQQPLDKRYQIAVTHIDQIENAAGLIKLINLLSEENRIAYILQYVEHVNSQREIVKVMEVLPKKYHDELVNAYIEQTETKITSEEHRNIFYLRQIFYLILSNIDARYSIDSILNKMTNDSIHKEMYAHTALTLAVLGGNISAASILLARNANPNQISRDNNETPFHLAVKQNNIEMVKLLLQYGADPFLRNANNQNAFMLVTNPEMLKILNESVEQFIKSVEEYTKRLKSVLGAPENKGLLDADAINFIKTNIMDDPQSPFLRFEQIKQINAKAKIGYLVSKTKRPDAENNYRKLLAKTEKKLHAKFRNFNDKVIVRDILVSGGLGEFDRKKRGEPEKDLVARMAAHVAESASVAIKAHLDDNFESDNVTIKPNCLNHITRLSFNEFSFYPSIEQGPLSKEGLIEFTNKLEEHAKTWPQNMHILAASVPVINENNEVYNIVFYVQCGKNPIINTTAKMAPSSLDNVYPGTANAYASTGSDEKYLERHIRNFLFPENNLKKIDVIENFIRTCLHDPNFKPNNDLEAVLRQQIDELKKGNMAAADHNINLIKDKIDEFKMLITDKATTIFSEFELLINKVPSATLSNEVTSTGNYYGGNIECKTVGGAVFTVNVDICVDHDYGIAKKTLHSKIKLTEETIEPTYIPTQTSQILTSATKEVITAQAI